MSRLLWLTVAALAGAAGPAEPPPPDSASPASGPPVLDSLPRLDRHHRCHVEGPPVLDSLPIRFEHAHGTASARWYPTKPGTRQRKRRKAQRQRGGR